MTICVQRELLDRYAQQLQAVRRLRAQGAAGGDAAIMAMRYLGTQINTW